MRMKEGRRQCLVALTVTDQGGDSNSRASGGEGRGLTPLHLEAWMSTLRNLRKDQSGQFFRRRDRMWTVHLLAH